MFLKSFLVFGAYVPKRYATFLRKCILRYYFHVETCFCTVFFDRKEQSQQIVDMFHVKTKAYTAASNFFFFVLEIQQDRIEK